MIPGPLCVTSTIGPSPVSFGTSRAAGQDLGTHPVAEAQSSALAATEGHQPLG